MNRLSGNSVSFWNSSPAIPHHAALRASPEVDVCIVGAGIAGLTAAYLLLRAGKTVIILEHGTVAAGETGRTTAHLSNAIDDGFPNLEKWHGVVGSRKAAQSHGDAIDLIEKIMTDEKIDCDFLRVDGFLFPAEARDVEELEGEFQAARRAKVKVAWVKKAPIKDFDTGKAIKFSNQAQFHVTKYLSGLAEVITRLGGKIYDGTHVSEIKQGDPATVTTSAGHHVKAHFVIEAANSLVSGKASTITKLFPYRTYAMAAEIAKDVVSKALFWDTEDPYHYVRTQPFDNDAKNSTTKSGTELLIIGGEDHKTGQADDQEARFQNLEAWARLRWPQMGEIKFRWSGQVLETIDGLALIGNNPGNEKNSFLISGDSGHGMTHGTLGGMIVSDLILGNKNPYADLYSPQRFHVTSAKPWIEENMNVAWQYTDWLKKGDIQNVDNIANDEGAVINKGFSKIAVYKDANGKVHSCSAVCTHLNGVVSWNSLEKTWDCPCHGSRFDRFGKATGTPAVDDLKPTEL